MGFRRFRKLRPHKKGFDEPSFVVEDFDGKPLTLRQLEAKDVLPSSADLRRLLIDDLGKAESIFGTSFFRGFCMVFTWFLYGFKRSSKGFSSVFVSFPMALSHGRSSRRRTCHHH